MPTQERPNILIFMTDHQRADTALPEHPAKTPNLDRLVAEGVTFTDTYCPSPHCCPARATFHTGLYPSRAGVWNNICNDQRLSRGLRPGVRTFGQDLADAGYRLGWSGKWHVSIEEGPADHGWQEYFVSSAAGAYHGLPWERYREIAHEPEPSERGEGEIIRPGYPRYRLYGTSDEGRHEHDTQALAGGLQALADLSAGDGPWCLFVGLGGPHDPYFVPQRTIDMYDLDDVPLPPSYHDEMADKPRVYQRMRRQMWGQLTEREIREGVRHFWAYCTLLDEWFGQVLAELDRSGQADDTLVLFTSDHGDYCGDHGLFAKGVPSFRGAYHVPAVVRWPRGIANPGRRVDAFVSLADLAPTFCEVAGVEAAPDLTGASLVPFLRDETPPTWRDEMWTQLNGVELYYTQRSVMTRDYKYVFNGFDEDELYDLRRDPNEMQNVALDPAFAQIKQEMCRRMWRFARSQDDAAINSYITVGLAPYGPAEAFRGEG